MSRHQGLVHFSFACLLVLLTGCGSRSVGVADEPEIIEEFILYSLDGNKFDLKQENADSDDHFHGFPILGKVDIKDVGRRKQIMDALKSGMSQSDGTVAKCYWPRHGVREVSKGKTVDYVICFECLQLKIHNDGKEKTVPTTRRPQSVLNKHLKDAKIPLAPGMAEDK